MEPERPTARSSPARGVALIATAVILGLFIVRNGFDTPSSADPDPATEESAGTTAPPAEGGGEGGESTTTTAAPAARPPSEVTVVVANASGVNGAAAQLTDTLAGQGYQTAPGLNAPSSVATTQILYLEGFEQEALALASTIQAPAEGVAPMPQPPPVDLGPAQLLVMLGPDLAGG